MPLKDERLHSLVPGLVEEQAAIRPNAIAVSVSAGEITYSELNRRADDLADVLRDLGVGPDVPVGLCFEGSIAMVVGALGILKAGAAYLPLDPHYPTERLSFILRDSGSPVLLTTDSFQQSLPNGPWQKLCLDEEGRTSWRPSRKVTAVDAAKTNLAYVIYTSGSTGQPKGVEISHQSLLNLVYWHRDAFKVTPSDRASQLAGVGFDAAVWEIWPYLTAGASLHPGDDTVRTDPESLRDWLLSRGITIGFVPTAMAERLMALSWPSTSSLRTVLTGADTLHHYPSADLPFQLVNNYGPTECTVVASSGIISPERRLESRPTIGKPISNTQIYILGEDRNPVPAGTPGELYIGGLGVARGYRNRPELNESRFLDNPFDPGGGCLFRTGDLGCYLPDGQIAFLGRVDDQIKIRGFRIEPTEIVTALNHHSSIRESAVVARESAAEQRRHEKQLIAYLVTGSEPCPTDSELRSFLRDCLPDYMIPSVFVQLERLPLTSHGKVDRAALPDPTPENTLEADSFVAPSTIIEERLAEILAPMLNVTRVGVNDNFFQLGGHSFLGAQVVMRVREVFGVDLTLRALFDHPSVRGMAAEIERLILARMSAMEEIPEMSKETS